MSQSPPVSPPPVGSELVYRPLSGLAVVGLALSGLFAVLVVVSALLGWFQSAPVMLPAWSLVVPALGALLSLAAQWRVSRSEGTLAGGTLARWGWWLALLAGVGYGVYYFTTGLAVQHQANRFLMVEDEGSGFFPRLQRGEVDAAFLLTLPAGRRVGYNPDDRQKMEDEFDRPDPRGKPGMLAVFRNNDVVLAAVEAGRAGNPVEALGVHSWAFEGRRCRVERTYRITTPEGQMDVLIPVVGEPDPEGGGRKWSVAGGQVRVLDNPRLTELGQKVVPVRMAANAFAQKWLQALRRGERPGAPPRDETKWGEVIVIKGGPVPADEARAAVRKELADALEAGGDRLAGVEIPEQRHSRWERAGGRLRLFLNFTAPALRDPESHMPRLVAQGELTVQTPGPFDPERSPAPAAWQITSFRVERIVPGPATLMKGPPKGAVD